MQEQPTFPYSADITRRVLNRERVSTYRAISGYVIENLDVKLIEDQAYGALIQLVSEVLTEHVVSETHTVEIDVPASWWQHFKRDVLCKADWSRNLIRRYSPVRMRAWTKDVRFNSKRVYPNAKVPPSPLGRPIIYETVNQTDWRHQ